MGIAFYNQIMAAGNYGRIVTAGRVIRQQWYITFLLCILALLSGGCASGRQDTTQDTVVKTFSGPEGVVSRIALVGDSTVADFAPEEPFRGWGQYFLEFVDTARVTVQNFAVSGRSSKSFISRGLWKKTLAAQPDCIFIQFGHNDARGPAYSESTDAATDFRDYLRQYITTARAQGAYPILVTPMHQGNWTKSRARLTEELLPYANAMREVAEETETPLVDLYRLSGTAFEKMGEAQMATLFARPDSDRTHFNEKGARLLAGMVAAETRRLIPKLRAYLK